MVLTQITLIGVNLTPEIEKNVRALSTFKDEEIMLKNGGNSIKIHCYLKVNNYKHQKEIYLDIKRVTGAKLISGVSTNKPY